MNPYLLLLAALPGWRFASNKNQSPHFLLTVVPEKWNKGSTNMPSGIRHPIGLIAWQKQN